MAHHVLHRRGLEAGMDHAIGALLIVADAVLVPLGVFHQLAEGPGVAFAEEIAGLLPAEHGACRVAPRRAAVGLVPGKEVQEHDGLAERPAPPALAASQDAAEQLLGLGAIEEVLLVGRALVGVTRRNGDAVQAQRLHVVEERRDGRGIGVVEERAIDADPESLRLGEPDRLDRLVVDAALTNRLVVHRLIAVEMDRPGEGRMWLEVVDPLGQQQRVGAQDHKFLAREETFDDARNLAMEQRLATGDRDDRCAAFVDRRHALVVRQALIEDLVGIVDLAATGAGEVAAKQRLQHQHERIALAAGNVLAQHVSPDMSRLQKGNAHGATPTAYRSAVTSVGSGFRSSLGSRNSSVSRTPSISSTSTGPCRRRVSMTSTTNSSGAEAPAVRPTVCTPSSHAGSSSLPSAIR